MSAQPTTADDSAFLEYAAWLQPTARERSKRIMTRTLRTNVNGQSALDVCLIRSNQESVTIEVNRIDVYQTERGFRRSNRPTFIIFTPAIRSTEPTEQRIDSWFSRVRSNFVKHRGSATTSPSSSSPKESNSSSLSQTREGNSCSTRERNSCSDPPSPDEVVTVVKKAFVEVTWSTQEDDLEQSEALTQLDDALTDIRHLLRPNQVETTLWRLSGQDKDTELTVQGHITEKEWQVRARDLRRAKLEVVSALNRYIEDWSRGEHGEFWLDPRTTFRRTPGTLPPSMMPQPPVNVPMLGYDDDPQENDDSDDEGLPMMTHRTTMTATKNVCQ
ncbi:hypothetical protein BCR39DRAFT_560414 [Naematelia encephala]|uniref:Uncharacterized protein n=1 Tax=Naematelia encephala TaxID=71784 RepID=A0A1Y2AWL0_9TREE|nr:hypothetical protein BCR39DRAFT_560414 [Naematelia encephala]